MSGESESRPPSCRFITYILELEGPLTPSEIMRKTTLCESTLNTALRRLREEDKVSTRPATDDARKTVYTLKQEP